MINDYIHMYSILPASSSPPLLFSEPKPRLPQWGTPKTPPTAYCCHPRPLKGPDNTQLSFRQLLPSSPSEEERGLREGGVEGDTNCRGIRTSVLTYYIYIPHPPPTPPTPTPAPPPFHALSLCGVQVPRSGAKSRERRGGEEK